MSTLNFAKAVLIIGLVTSFGSTPVHAMSWWERWRNFLLEWDTDSIVIRPHENLRASPIFLDRDDIRDVHFYLFTDPENPDFMQEVHIDDPTQSSLEAWDPSVPTKIIVHGFIQNINATFPQNVKNAYLKRSKDTGQKYNILVVDWGRLAYQLQDGVPVYTRAVRNVEKVGTRIGELVMYLHSLDLVTPSSLHLIGQSLGAHVVGQAGHWLQEQKPTPFLVARITGLDPAGPLFYTGLVGRLLKTEDAAFVDVVHCNPGGLGVVAPAIVGPKLGTVEFYVNWDPLTHLQPQCVSLGHVITEKEGWMLCSHNYCPKFFAWSIITKLEARQCYGVKVHPTGCVGPYARFGEDLSTSEQGMFFIKIQNKLDDMQLFMP